LAVKLSDIGKIIAKALQSKTVLDAAGASIAESIIKRTRLGRGVDIELGPSKPLKKLASKTVSNRKRLKEEGKLTGPNATPGKSGLNQSGDMLDSISYRVPTKGKLEIIFTDSEQQKKAKWIQEKDPRFNFFNVSKAEMNRAIREMSEAVTFILEKIKFDKL
jgi:hypothetical protein